MELKKSNGQEIISSEELHLIKKFAQQIGKFKNTYFVFNRQLNSLFKVGEQIMKKGETK